MEKGLLIEKNLKEFWVDSKKGVVKCFSRGKNNKLIVGDKVFFSDNCIEKIEERKNSFIRPPVANVDKMLIFISTIPEPDFLLLDKMLLFCFEKNVEPIIVVSKYDLDNFGFCSEVEKVYNNICKVFCISSHSGYNIDVLVDYIKNNICILTGQSGVGKSSFLNYLFPNFKLIVGDVSEKILKGKNTTNSVKLYKYNTDTFLCDTAGFSCLDENLLNMNCFELQSFYPDFLRYANMCKFKPCSHLSESYEVCAVKQAVEKGEIDSGRYMRYQRIFSILYERWKKYGK